MLKRWGISCDGKRGHRLPGHLIEIQRPGLIRSRLAGRSRLTRNYEKESSVAGNSGVRQWKASREFGTIDPFFSLYIEDLHSLAHPSKTLVSPYYVQFISDPKTD